jgi:hypothetical protein
VGITVSLKYPYVDGSFKDISVFTYIKNETNTKEYKILLPVIPRLKIQNLNEL